MSRQAAEHHVISASAGSGKTYRLTNRYLALLADGVPPTQLWATTFTRKAAGEILDRLLSRLTDAAASDEGAHGLATAMDRPAMTRSDCVRLLRTLLAEIHRLRIGTMDSLFQRMAGPFAMELGLPAGWSVADEADIQSERENALDGALSGDERRIEELARLYERLSPLQAQRGVRDDLLEKVNRLYAAFLAVPAAGWQTAVGVKPGVPVDDIIARAAGFDLQHKTANKELAKDITRARNGQWQEFAGSGLAGKVLSGEQTYQRKPIPPELADCYRQLLQAARWSIQQAAASEIAAARDFLGEYHLQIRRIKDEGRGLEFDDVTRALATGLGAIESGLSYRMDDSIGHLLLDEFQDTSILQWRAIEPLIRMVMSGGGSVFAVGDAKQAIFGWRGGRSELLQRLPGLMGGITAEEMDHSRRSAPVVIDAVNRVFQGITGFLNGEQEREAAANWQSRFRPHTTERSALPGYVHVETGPRQEDGNSINDHRGSHYGWVATRVAEIVRMRPTATVGVLCRKNTAVARLVYELRKLGISASQEGGSPITDSAAVEAILSLLTLADHPGDTVAAFHLATEPLSEMLRAHGYDPSAPGETARRVRYDLMNLGYGPLVARWATHLKSMCPQSDCDRLDQLMEVADAYQGRATLRPADFVAWVRQVKASAVLPSFVRVLTLHTAKGLEYDAVILPELDVGFSDRNTGSFVVSEPDPPELPDGFVGRRVTSKLRPLAAPSAVEQTDLAARRAIEESMSLLYVALTRAKQGLYLFPPGPERRERGDCWDTAIMQALCPGQTIGVKDRAEKQLLCTTGNPDWQPPASESPLMLPDPAGTIRFAPAGFASRPRDWVAPSHQDGIERRMTAARLFDDPNSMNRRAGDLHHSWFAAIEWVDDGEPSDDMLRQLAAAFRLADAELVNQIAAFRKAIRQPAIRAIFSKAANPDCVRVERERPFAVREGEQLIVGRVDRLTLSRDKSGELSAEIIDFKTDDIRSDVVPMRLAHYRPQIESYLRATAKFGHIPLQRITGTIVFTVAGRIERISLPGGERSTTPAEV